MPTGGEKHDSPSTRATFRRYFRSTSRRRTSCPPLRNVANEWLIERRFRSNDDLKRQWMDRDVRGAIVSLKWECDSVGSGDKNAIDARNRRPRDSQLDASSRFKRELPFRAGNSFRRLSFYSHWTRNAGSDARVLCERRGVAYPSRVHFSSRRG